MLRCRPWPACSLQGCHQGVELRGAGMRSTMRSPASQCDRLGDAGRARRGAPGARTAAAERAGGCGPLSRRRRLALAARRPAVWDGRAGVPTEAEGAVDQHLVAADRDIGADLEVGQAQLSLVACSSARSSAGSRRSAQPRPAPQSARAVRLARAAGAGQARDQVPGGLVRQGGRVGGGYHQAPSAVRPPPAQRRVGGVPGLGVPVTEHAHYRRTLAGGRGTAATSWCTRWDCCRPERRRRCAFWIRGSRASSPPPSSPASTTWPAAGSAPSRRVSGRAAGLSRLRDAETARLPSREAVLEGPRGAQSRHQLAAPGPRRSDRVDAAAVGQDRDRARRGREHRREHVGADRRDLLPDRGPRFLPRHRPWCRGRPGPLGKVGGSGRAAVTFTRQLRSRVLPCHVMQERAEHRPRIAPPGAALTRSTPPAFRPCRAWNR